MDNKKPSSQNDVRPDLPSDQEQVPPAREPDFFLGEDIYPDLGFEPGIDPLLAESFDEGFLLDATIDEELPVDMTNFNAIEARFHNLLKERLLKETLNNPPRFPWETGMEAYFSEEERQQISPTTSPWLPQLAAFDIPFQIPEPKWHELLQACMTAMQSLEPQGIKLVRAAQSLFEVEDLMLHQLASWVLATPQPSRSKGGVVLEGDFQQADQQQQIVMSMIAAQKIFDRLSLMLTPDKPGAESVWDTTAGAIAIQARYKGQTIQVSVNLPQGGQVTWESAQGSASASRMYPGELCLTLVDCQFDSVYPVTISLNQGDASPITVAIALKSA